MNTSFLTELEPITLEQMKCISLMNRIDTKYCLPASRLGEFLSHCKEYYVQTSDGDIRLHRYDTLYYDTEEYHAYLMHQRAKAPRQKLRARCYVDGGGDCFLEIKNKTNRKRTKKKRVPLPEEFFGNFPACNQVRDFAAGRSLWDIDSLSPALRIGFKRITLVNRELNERVTIDTALCFHNPRTGLDYDLSDLVVIELKRDGNLPSRVQSILLEMRVMPTKFSKYCTGIILTTPGIRLNRFKERLITLNKLLNGKLTNPAAGLA